MKTGAVERLELSSWALTAAPRAYLGLLGLASKSAANSLDCVQGLVNAKSPSEVAHALENSARAQLDAFSEEVEELSALVMPGDENLGSTFWD